ncbi:MAG TPA: bifunctional phosphopantothenoylcysteine decarboxylase/phosphopantothenate--cysteine ligase CoaBC [Candidatus Hydrogenedentes bacterium]|jgi:phosphopantothenoylcysteine decarboxylase/phosphopantothenate--cysteine ligase|nr:MAG: Coenzyme A biosynthesis bifunctional protein CoaBC [Candidatus Hydrogenedentes bacterium ADurb.Bin170]HPX86590.1 bifunctional phosphopantothenoylcysteine decarboxylase/phosphopantothenate--cysteine ligase CoaBC [Candidatus Hydrogenedentota bacterium]
MNRFFADKTVLLGITGSIAVFKACELVSRMRELGARVHCALTRSGAEMIQPATLEALSGNPVITEMFGTRTGHTISHIAMTRQADLIMVAPATANILAKAAQGIGDDWLSTALLAARSPVLFAPAMNTFMYTHAATQANIALLKERGVFFVGPAPGRLACGEEGPGRMAEVPELLEAAAQALHPQKDLASLRVLITSGPNFEPIDAARYIGNRSSGKMGYALALEALCRGAAVCVVSGPATQPPPVAAEIVSVQTAREMYNAVLERLPGCDILIGAAAVADYRIALPDPGKIKRSDEPMALHLVPNPDILAEAAAKKKAGQRFVGFAAETENAVEKAREKLQRKQLDMIVANLIGGERCAIGSDCGDAWILTAGGVSEAYPQVEKATLAKYIFDHLVSG